MIPNADIVGGACEEVVDILENIPSDDNERRSTTDVGACDIISGWMSRMTTLFMII
jgi:hypothetical protein